MGQTMNVAPVNFDPENSMEYRKYREMGDEVRAALQQVMETARGGAAAQPTRAGGARARFGGSGGRSVGLPRLRRTEQRKIL